MTQHTPGPWTIEGMEIQALVDPENSDTYYAPICLMDDEWTESIIKANARLIAAAPELLEALESLASWAIEAQKKLPVETWADLENHGTIQILDASAALALARGE